MKKTVNVTPSHFIENLQLKDYRSIYQQLSADYQAELSYEALEAICEEVMENNPTFELVSKMTLQEFVEHQWLAREERLGIRAWFTEDGRIHLLHFMPVNMNANSDNVVTANTYQFPFKGEWLTFWGGQNEIVNYHYPIESQRYAYDFVVNRNGFTFDGSPDQNENYYAFGKEVFAPYKGTVATVVSNQKDVTPGTMTNETEPFGNYVILAHEQDEYSLICHLKENSITVREGDVVEQGALLGQCGNSGHTSEPHIHFHVMNGLDPYRAASIRIKSEKEPVRGTFVCV
ncbi:M23 family metallopeptidase [Shouchella hunanensis]|uniref:M23 family metallopeptidase n=1 Tax=Shouchella hunanensis TaxID=766894 RepID=A0ABY7W0Y6_9BACI|nr:M23 family metallopeptidase [Shouchella hunanensis]WDF02343.1 M23 family metallopeptidase [Shouchella hunanensis]